MYENALFICFFVLILQFKSGNSQCFNEEAITIPQLGLSESQFWNAKAQDLEQCSKLCIRRKPCLSITYDTQSGMCELNAGTSASTPTKTAETLLYSEFQWWPPSLDKNCHSRPCQDSEACIPGGLAGGSPDCSYSCMKVVRDVCPLPPGGVTNGRTVGSVNSYTCGKGTVGGGSATCLPSYEWDKEISPTCTPILGNVCSDDTICSLINGACSAEGHCECGPYKTYDDANHECVLDCGNPPAVANTKVSGTSTSQTYQCNADYFPTTGSQATVTCTETGWEPAGKFACYTCGVPPVVAGATVQGNGVERQYKCSQDMYPLPGTGDGIITCDEATNSWVPAGFLCGGLRLFPSLFGDMMAYFNNSGYLEMFADGNWRALTVENWTWQATMVACKTLFGLEHGGTFHREWFGRTNPDRQSLVSKLEGTECTGDETSLELCPKFQLKNGNGDKEIAITCFELDPGFVSFDGNTSETSGTVFVDNFGVLKGGVCGTGWNDRATTVACRNIDPAWTRAKECTNNCYASSLMDITTNHINCNGDEPHLFYCENKGWGYHADCDTSNLVGIECKL